MRTITELRDDLSHAVRSAEDIVARAEKENRETTAEERKSSKDFLDEAERIKSQIKSLEDDEKLRQTVKSAADALKEPLNRIVPPTQPTNGQPTDEPSVRVVPTHERIGPLKAFTPARFNNSVQAANFAAYKCAMWLAATIYGSRKADRWMQDNVSREWRAAHSEGVNTEGGYLVPDEMSATIIDLRESYGVFRQFCRVRPMASETLKIPRKAARWSPSWTAEATALTQSSTAFDNVQLIVKKLGGYALISTELADDAVVSIVDELIKDFGIGLAKAEDEAGFTGDGTPTYAGIRGLTNLFTAGSRAGAVDAVAGHDTFAEIDNVDITNVMAKLPDYARMNAKFYCSRTCAATVFGRLKAVAGGNTIQTLEGAIWGDYLGTPIVVSQVLPSSTSTINDTAMLFYGDLSMSSSLGERRGVTVKRSDEIKFLEDQIALKVTERIDINNHDVGDATDAGAIVALIGNT